MKIDSIRREYKLAELSEKDVPANPVDLFRQWMNDALEAGLNDATSMSLVTAGTDGFPQSRIVLLKNFGPEGFTFFTNYNSQKGQAIANDPRVSIHFFWPELERQVRITGFAEKTSAEISDNYFNSRPVDSQIAAIVSNQSSVVESRQYLDSRFNEIKIHLNNNKPMRPAHWGGYIVNPVKLEFWQGRENRMHDRIVYEKSDANWLIKRLAP